MEKIKSIKRDFSVFFLKSGIESMFRALDTVLPPLFNSLIFWQSLRPARLVWQDQTSTQIPKKQKIFVLFSTMDVSLFFTWVNHWRLLLPPLRHDSTWLRIRNINPLNLWYFYYLSLIPLQTKKKLIRIYRNPLWLSLTVHRSPGEGGGGYLTHVWVYGCRRGFEILTLFRTKILQKPYPV